MKTSYGVHVEIKADGKLVRDFKNPHEKRYPDFSGEFNSRLVTINPDTTFEVVVTFDERFAKFSETGLLITIGWGEYSQSFWLDYEHVKLFQKHVFSTLTVWSSDRNDAVQRRFRMQMPGVHPVANATADWMYADVYYPNAGCIAVWVERGNLSDFRDEHEPYEWVFTDPPKNTRYIESNTPKVVRSEWFHWLRSDNGLPHVFEFRNMDSGDVRCTSKSPQTVLDHIDNDAFVSDDETGSSDRSLSDNDWKPRDNDAHSGDEDEEQYDYRSPRRTRPKRKRGPDLSDMTPPAKVPRRSVAPDTNATVRALATPTSRIVALPVGRHPLSLPRKMENEKKEGILHTAGNVSLQEQPSTGLAIPSSLARKTSASRHSEEKAPTPTISIKHEPKVKVERASPDRNIKHNTGTGNSSQLGKTITNAINLISDDEEEVLKGPASSLAFQPLLPEEEDAPMRDKDGVALGKAVPPHTVRTGEDVDIDDLEDQLKEVQLKMAIRAARKGRQQQQGGM